MSAADKVVSFTFTRPGKSDSKGDKPKTKDEPKDDDDSAPTRADLGKALREAYEAEDDEAITEAVLKIMEQGKDAD